MKISRTLFFLVVVFNTCVNAQDKLHFLSGKVLEGKVVEVDSLDIKFERIGRKKTKKMYVGKDRIFSIQYENGETDILYDPQFDDADFSKDEMNLFVMGAHDARYGHKAPWPFIGGVIVGAGSVLLLPFPIYFAFLPTAAYTMVIGRLNPKINEELVSDLSLLKEEAYILGFKNKTKNINIQNAIKGSLIGLIGGVILHPLIYPIPSTK